MGSLLKYLINSIILQSVFTLTIDKVLVKEQTAKLPKGDENYSKEGNFFGLHPPRYVGYRGDNSSKSVNKTGIETKIKINQTNEQFNSPTKPEVKDLIKNRTETEPKINQTTLKKDNSSTKPQVKEAEIKNQTGNETKINQTTLDKNNSSTKRVEIKHRILDGISEETSEECSDSKESYFGAKPPPPHYVGKHVKHKSVRLFIPSVVNKTAPLESASMESHEHTVNIHPKKPEFPVLNMTENRTWVDLVDDHAKKNQNATAKSLKTELKKVEAINKVNKTVQFESHEMENKTNNRISKMIDFESHEVRLNLDSHPKVNKTIHFESAEHEGTTEMDILTEQDETECTTFPDKNQCQNHSACYFRCKDETCQLSLMTKKDNCSEKCLDKCGCKREGCQSSSTGNCLSVGVECTNSAFYEGECGRPKLFYSVGGALCRNSKSRGNCDIEKTVFAVNLNGNLHRDKNGITFLHDDPSLYLDPSKIKRKDEIKSKTTHKDAILYTNFIRGDGKQSKMSSACVTYPVKACVDGRYELNIKTIEPTWKKAGSRSFSVFLNDLPIMVEVDLFKLTNRRHHSLDLILNFNISDGGQTLKWNGLPSTSPINNGILNISFCTGKCIVPDPSFVVSAFSILKLIDLPPHPVPEGHSCINYRNNPCECSSNGCQYDPIYGDCLPGRQDCSQCEFDDSGYIRSNSYYVNNVVCKAHREMETLPKPFETIWAINLNGTEYVDTKGIKYGCDSTLTNWGFVQDPQTLLTYHTNENCPTIQNVIGTDRKLYDHFVRIGGNSSGLTENCDSNQCVTYPIPLCQDGVFELKINFMDSGNLSNQAFTTKLNNITVLHTLNVSLFSKPCQAVELNSLFKVSQSVLHIKGHTPTRISDQEIFLSFCESECSGAFEISAFSFIRYDEPSEMDLFTHPHPIYDRCSAFRDPCGCRMAQCDFNSEFNECISGGQVCNQCSFHPSECRRTNALYSNGGHICHNPSRQRGLCKLSKVILATSLYDIGPFTDKRGVSFIPGSPMENQVESPYPIYRPNYKIPYPIYRSNYILPYPYLKPWDHPLNIYDTRSLHQRARDMNISFYDYFIYGGSRLDRFRKSQIRRNSWAGLEERNCIKYQVPLHLEGKYELTIITSVHSNEFKPIIITFNGKRIAEEFHPSAHLSNIKPEEDELELVVNFEVEENGKSIHLKGYPSSEIIGGKVILAFCSGNCDKNDGLDMPDPTTAINAFSIVKFDE